jgi:hypothetical protein|tara:strand:- start:143 stop:904 length:762 start_codon:yes stop_codon:yes gene_type:complete
MAKQTINIGSSADDGTGTTIRAGGDLINDNFNEIYNYLGDGSSLNGTIFSVVDESSTSAAITVGETLGITGGTNLTTAVSGDNVNITLNSTVTGLTSVQTETLTNASGNLLVASATNITEFRGDGSSVEGQIKLNCHANSHGQTIKPQPHSAGVTNTMLLPQGSNSTLVSEIATQTLTNKTIGVGQLTCNTRAYTGDGSTVAFTVTNGQTVQNVLVFINGVFQRPTTDFTISGTTLTFGTAPVTADTITIKEL